MLFVLLVSHCGPETVSKEELNEQLRDECVLAFVCHNSGSSPPIRRYGVDVIKAISLGGAPPADADYTLAEERLSAAMRAQGTLSS